MSRYRTLGGIHPEWVVGCDRRQMKREYNRIWRQMRRIEFVAGMLSLAGSSHGSVLGQWHSISKTQTITGAGKTSVDNKDYLAVEYKDTTGKKEQVMPEQPPKWLKVDIKQMQAEYDRLLDELKSIEEMADRFGIPLSKRSTDATAGGQLSGLTVRDAAYEVLAEHDRPMHLSELFEKLNESGVRIGGRDKKNSLFATIRGDQRFVNLGRNTWDLKERQAETESNDKAEV